MKDWCKRFFGAFFFNKYAERNGNGGMTVTVVGYFVALVLLIAFLFLGYLASFGTMYGKSSAYMSTVRTALTDCGGIAVTGARAHTDGVINTFDGDEKYAASGYTVIIDTRPKATNYGEFRPFYFSGDNAADKSKQITAEEYHALTQEERERYKFGIERLGGAVDTVAGISLREQYFAALDHTDDPSYAQVKAEYTALQEQRSTLSERDYADRLYVLYTKAQYPEITSFDAYAEVPTLRTYYLVKLSESKTDKYFVVFDEGSFGSFVTDGGVRVNFTGVFDGDARYNGNDGADMFVKDAFYSAWATSLADYLTNSLFMVLFTAVAFGAVAVLHLAACRLGSLEYCNKAGASLNMVGTFQFVSAVITSIIAFGMSYATSQTTVRNISVVIYAAVMLVRTAVLFTMRYLTARKAKKVQADTMEGNNG